MTLELLANLDRDAAVALLLAASAATGPIKSAREANLSSDVIRLLNEIKSKNGLRSDDKSERAAEILDAELADALQEAIFETVSMDEIRELMLEDGSLKASDHDIVFTDDNNIDDDSRAAVLYIIANPSLAEFISPPNDVRNENQAGPYIFVRESGLEPHNPWYLVFTVKNGFKLEVQYAFSVFPGVVNLEGARTARDVLFCFAQEYGVDMELPEGGAAKIVFNRYADSLLEPKASSQDDIDHYLPVTASYKAYYEELNAGFMVIGIQFFVDMKKYQADLDRYTP